MTPADGVGRSHRVQNNFARRVSAAGAGLIVLAIVVAALCGWRGFVVATPSMGTAAPVGTLVLTAPVRIDAVERGDIITFRPTAGRTSYTHRVVAITPEGLRTKGDINAAQDPWTITQDQLVGRSVALIPAAGWAVRALPWLLVGIGGLLIASQAVGNPMVRSGLRVVGVALVISITALSVRPFVGFTIVSTRADLESTQVSVVSTGLLPITVSAPGADSLATLHSGDVGTLIATAGAEGRIPLTGHLDLDMTQWLLLSLVCLTPLFWCLIAGFPRAREIPS
jgi:signal peptidase I